VWSSGGSGEQQQMGERWERRTAVEWRGALSRAEGVERCVEQGGGSRSNSGVEERERSEGEWRGDEWGGMGCKWSGNGAAVSVVEWG
jgi:hypothetical protein